MKNSKIKLGYRERDKLFKKEFTELKIKVALNWFEIFSLLAVSFFISLKLHSFILRGSQLHPILFSFITCIIITGIFCFFRKYKLKITRFDKEDIYKKISIDLFDESRNEL